jgi:hypothetical protein
MRKTPSYVEGGKRDPRNPPSEKEEQNEAATKAKDAPVKD